MGEEGRVVEMEVKGGVGVCWKNSFLFIFIFESVLVVVQNI